MVSFGNKMNIKSSCCYPMLLATSVVQYDFVVVHAKTPIIY